MKKFFVYGILKDYVDGVKASDEAELDGHKKIRGVGGYDTVIPQAGEKVTGRLLTVTDTTAERFDAIEGWPQFYLRKQVTVRNLRTGQLNRTAWVYFQPLKMLEHHGFIRISRRR